MMRTLGWSFTCALALLGLAASLELAGLQSALGALSHTTPGGLIASAADSIGMGIPSHGLVLGQAHGPPFLRPLGIVIVYGLPVALLAVILIRARSRTRSHG
jgi:hypothetical protein